MQFTHRRESVVSIIVLHLCFRYYNEKYISRTTDTHLRGCDKGFPPSWECDMKIKCDFCKTQYVVSAKTTGRVRCAVCGHTFAPPAPKRKNAFMTVIAAITALLAVVVFAFVVIVRHNVNDIKQNPLVAEITGVTVMTDHADISHFVVTGTVKNRAGEIYGMPNLIVNSFDMDDRVVARQKFMPTATLLDAGASVEFKYTLAAPTTGVNKVTVELAK